MKVTAHLTPQVHRPEDEPNYKRRFCTVAA